MCPLCREPMVTLELEGSEVDRCVTCGGTWLDSGEIELLATMDPATVQRLTEALAAAAPGTRTERRCPRCPRHLREIELGAERRLRLDRCPRAHGFWFDAGEMRALIEIVDGHPLESTARFFAELYRNLATPTSEEAER